MKNKIMKMFVTLVLLSMMVTPSLGSDIGKYGQLEIVDIRESTLFDKLFGNLFLIITPNVVEGGQSLFLSWQPNIQCTGDDSPPFVLSWWAEYPNGNRLGGDSVDLSDYPHLQCGGEYTFNVRYTVPEVEDGDMYKICGRLYDDLYGNTVSELECDNFNVQGSSGDCVPSICEANSDWGDWISMECADSTHKNEERCWYSFQCIGDSCTGPTVDYGNCEQRTISCAYGEQCVSGYCRTPTTTTTTISGQTTTTVFGQTTTTIEEQPSCNGDGICGSGETYDNCVDCIISCEEKELVCKDTCFENNRIYDTFCDYFIVEYKKETDRVKDVPREVKEGLCGSTLEECGTKSCVVTGTPDSPNPRCVDNGCDPPCVDKCEDGKAYKQAYCKDSILGLSPTCNWLIVQDCAEDGRECFLDVDGHSYCNYPSEGSYSTCTELCLGEGFREGGCYTINPTYSDDLVLNFVTDVYLVDNSRGEYGCGFVESCYCWGETDDSDVDKIWDFAIKYWKTLLLVFGALYILSLLK